MVPVARVERSSRNELDGRLQQPFDLVSEGNELQAYGRVDIHHNVNIAACSLFAPCVGTKEGHAVQLETLLEIGFALGQELEDLFSALHLGVTASNASRGLEFLLRSESMEARHCPAM